MHRQQPEQTDFARRLRSASTDAETALWQRLRSRQLGGAKFRRQFVLGPYVADFVCVEYRLVVECDGGQHADSSHDAARDTWMREQGWQVLRFWNHDVLQNMEGVLTLIAGALGQRRGLHLPSPQPSPLKGEGAKPPGVGCIAPLPFQEAEAKPPGVGCITPLPFQEAGAKPPGVGCITPSPFKGEGWGEGKSPTESAPQ